MARVPLRGTKVRSFNPRPSGSIVRAASEAEDLSFRRLTSLEGVGFRAQA